MRQPILYAEEMWRRQRFWVLFLVVVGIGMTAFNLLFVRGVRTGDPSTWVWGAYIPGGLLLGGAFMLYRRRSYVAAGERLRVCNLLSSVDIDYDLVRGVRVQPLKAAFQESDRRRLRGPIVRPLEEKPALFIRLRRDDPEAAAIIRKLGARLAYEDTIALPVPDPDALAWEISSQLPERTGVNLGGRRRRKRRR